MAALFIWAPIPLGSNRPWAWSILQIGAFALLGTWILTWVAGAAKVPDTARQAWPALAMLGAWLLYQSSYVVPLPPAMVELLSPEAARLQRLTEVAGISREIMTLSVDPHASRVSLMKSLAYGAVFFLLLVLVSTRGRLLQLARVLVYAAVVHASYAVLMHLSGARGQFLGAMIDHGSQASGTFVNRNHFAGYLEMMLALGIGLLLAGVSDRRADSLKRFVRNLLEWILSQKMVLRLALCVLVIALTTTHSRMGNTAFFSSLLVTGAIGIALSRHATRNTVVLLSTLVVIDLLIVGSWFGVEKLARRLGETTLGDVELREEPAAYTLGMIADYPLLGSGPGTFYAAFPRYRPESITVFFDFAHNDYAQFAAESGLLGVTLLALFVGASLVAALRAQWLRRDPAMRGMSFASIMGTISLLIHSSVDFNLQIPANAMLFLLMLSLGWISLYLDRADPGQRGLLPRREPERPA